MTSDKLLAIFREEVGDTELPYGWSTALIYSHMDEAQKMFCRLTDGIADSTSALTELELIPNEAWVYLHPSILRVRSVRGVRGEKFDVIPVERLEQEGIRLDERRGRTRVLVSGMDENLLRAWPIPVDNVDLESSVFRLPLVEITEADQELEIRAEHQYALLHWMKHLAYGKQDTETYDPQASKKFEDKFRQYCENAKAEQAKLRRTPMPIAYGGY